MRRSLVPLVLVLAAVFAPPPAHADARKARQHSEQGTKLYNLNRFDEALREYEAAYLEKKDAVLLYNIAQCHRQLGNKPEAIRFYKNYLRDAGDAAHRAEVEKRIAEIEEAIAAEARARNAPPTGVADAPKSPADEPAASPAPEPAPDLGAPPIDTTVASQPPAPEEARPLTGRWWFWAGIGAVVIGAVAIGFAATRGGQDPGCPDGVVCK